jgi:hypothetical protein
MRSSHIRPTGGQSKYPPAKPGALGFGPLKAVGAAYAAQFHILKVLLRNITRLLRVRFENRRGDSAAGSIMIQALDVDRAEPWPDGQDRQEDQALPV